MKSKIELELENFLMISVIIPVYNVESYLRECVDSVLNQTYTDFELILVDDGSTDKSGMICDEYAGKDKRIQVIHKSNEGQGVARNIGMQLAKGKYLIFLDSDDYWDIHTLEIVYTEAEKNDLDIVMFSLHSFCDGATSVCGKTGDAVFRIQNRLVRSGAECWDTMLRSDEYSMSICRRMYRTDFLRRLGIQFPPGCIHEDESFSFLSCMAAQRVEQLSDILYYRRWRPGSTMTCEIKKYAKSARGYSIVLREVLETYRQKKYTMTALERKLFLHQIKLYFNQIQNLYLKERETYKKGAYKIQRDVQSTLRKAAAVLPGLTAYEKMCGFNLNLACFLLSVKMKVAPRKK